MKNFLSIQFIFFAGYLLAQRGKDGANTVTISTANSIVNQYTSLTVNAINTSTLAVTSSTAFSVGDLVFIIQMQGATVNAGRDTLYPDVNSSIPTNSSYGALTNYHAAGNYEFAQVNSTPTNTSIALDCQLTHSYVAAGKVQVIKVPRYTDLLITGAGSITSPNWNGTTGGVVVVEVSGNLTMNSVGSFSVTGKGFRGGAKINQNLTYLAGGDKYGSILVQEGAYKGESIAGDTTRYKVYSGVFGRGAIANGGGGGCTHNAGGGGGANGGNIAAYSGFGNPASGYNAAWAVDGVITTTHTSSGGGRGGYSYSSSNQAVTLAPGNTNWQSDNRRNVGGLGGRPLNYSLGKLFIGGGGGAGHGNDSRASAGGNGGGMVFIQCYGNLNGSGTIVADGDNANNTISGCNTNDGAGGGGGGGTIILNVAGTTNLTAGTALFARGGNGGNVNFNCTFSNSTGYGPGAGGGGGYIASNNILPALTVAGGNNGIHFANANNIGNNFPPNGATAGGIGSTGSSVIYTITTSSNQTLCVNQAFTVTASTNQPGASINWYNTLVGGNPITTGASYASSGYSVNGTYTLYAGYCNQGTYRVPVVLTVNTGLNISVNTTSICPGQSATLTANPASAISYTWNSGANTNSIVVSPTVTTSYTVNGSIGICSGVQTTTVYVSVQPNLVVTTTQGGCAPVCVTFVNTPINSDELISYNFGDGNSSSSANPVHCYSVSGTYSTGVSVTNTVSGCSFNYPITAPIIIEDTPIADFSFSNTNEIIVGDVIETSNSSVNSNTYDWLICGSQTSTLNTVSIATQDTGTCCVRLIARNINCIDTVIKCIKIADNPKIEIPNVFTPNNDGNNDVFIIKGRSIKTFSCIIYDRWGLKIIELASINKGWDGKHANGNLAADGTYYYIINYTDSKGVSKTEKGFLSLFRE